MDLNIEWKSSSLPLKWQERVKNWHIYDTKIEDIGDGKKEMGWRNKHLTNTLYLSLLSDSHVSGFHLSR